MNLFLQKVVLVAIVIVGSLLAIGTVGHFFGKPTQNTTAVSDASER
jgi:hypothetical protein